MKAVKCKGYSKELNKWVVGYLLEFAGQSFIVGEEGDSVLAIDQFESAYTEVVPESVGRYTEFVDKKGIEIYKGDIVEFPSFYKEVILEDGSGPVSENPQICEVIRKDGCFGVIPDEDFQFFHEFYSFRQIMEEIGIEQEEIEVIGNIYENPELLRGEK